uniref:Uncharacterized protein n=1 Tax=uncultured bacterium fosmid pJB148G3 TaxID=1478052 RepID=A0A0H3U8N4_9BACT|nr:hypothetical protein [uncultured bacterium fosmid pJB148G3]
MRKYREHSAVCIHGQTVLLPEEYACCLRQGTQYEIRHNALRNPCVKTAVFALLYDKLLLLGQHTVAMRVFFRFLRFDKYADFLQFPAEYALHAVGIELAVFRYRIAEWGIRLHKVQTGQFPHGRWVKFAVTEDTGRVQEQNARAACTQFFNRLAHFGAWVGQIREDIQLVLFPMESAVEQILRRVHVHLCADTSQFPQLRFRLVVQYAPLCLMRRASLIQHVRNLRIRRNRLGIQSFLRSADVQ